MKGQVFAGGTFDVFHGIKVLGGGDGRAKITRILIYILTLSKVKTAFHPNKDLGHYTSLIRRRI